MMSVEMIMTPKGDFIEVDGEVYAERVRQLEREGMTTSDAQGVADIEFLSMAKATP